MDLDYSLTDDVDCRLNDSSDFNQINDLIDGLCIV